MVPGGRCVVCVERADRIAQQNYVARAEWRDLAWGMARREAKAIADRVALQVWADAWVLAADIEGAAWEGRAA
jgi:hypothetical protein